MSEVPLYSNSFFDLQDLPAVQVDFAMKGITGVPHLQENAPPSDPTVGIRLGS